MHDDRCLTCDRVIATPDNVDDGMCEVELSYNSRRRSSDWNLRARRACDDHAVDWRTRALAAEAALVELTERAVSRAAIPPIDAVAEKMVDDLVAANRPAAGKRTAIAKAAPDVYLAPWEAEDLLKRIGNTYDLETTAGRNRADAAMRRALDLLGVSAPSAPAPVARPISEWHEDRGSALWWRFPVEEPPYSGTPLNSDWPGYHTHWTPIVCPDEPHDQADADPASRGPIGRPVCSTCNDSHAMTIGDRTVMCTRCPTPCHACRAGGNGPFCGSTPCPCKCHAKIGGGS